MCSLLISTCAVLIFGRVLFCNDTPTTEIYTNRPTLSRHYAIPIAWRSHCGGDGMQVGDPLLGLVALRWRVAATFAMAAGIKAQRRIDRKSTRLNSSH